MSKFASKLGKQYGKVKEEAKLRKINISLGEVSFDLKVRIPIKSEMEIISRRISEPSKERIDDTYIKLSKPIRELMETSDKDFVAAVNASKDTIIVQDNDLIIDGNSVRQVAMFTVMWECKVEEYFHLLQSETGEAITESYEEISAEFPDIAIKEIIESIENKIKPDYATTKKN
jgi:hypothetical protein